MLPSWAKGWCVMQRYSRFQSIVLLLFVGIVLTFSAGPVGEGLWPLGLVLIVASAIVAIALAIGQRRDTRR
jgi:hypothetical protein